MWEILGYKSSLLSVIHDIMWIEIIIFNKILKNKTYIKYRYFYYIKWILPCKNFKKKNFN